MKFSRPSLCLAFCASFFLGKSIRAGEVETHDARNTVFASDSFDVPHWEIAAESAYLCSIIGNPNSYEIGAEFITARLRWGVNRDDASWFRGYNQVYLLAMAEPIFRGPENRYFGISAGFRHVFIRPGWRIEPYTSGGVGLGFIDSTDEFRQGQGQDFTFNILTAAGFDYRLDDHWKISAGILYQHLSNAGLSDPNPSLNLLGPQVGATFSF
jgi:Lipid A 3-O-deacylase (PagL)